MRRGVVTVGVMSGEGVAEGEGTGVLVEAHPVAAKATVTAPRANAYSKLRRPLPCLSNPATSGRSWLRRTHA